MVCSISIHGCNVILQVLGSHHFHLLAFHVIQGNQVIVRGDKRKTVESVLNCLKVSCIEMTQFWTNKHFIHLFLCLLVSLFSLCFVLAVVVYCCCCCCCCCCWLCFLFDWRTRPTYWLADSSTWNEANLNLLKLSDNCDDHITISSVFLQFKLTSTCYD